MKLLIDNNISYKVCPTLQKQFKEVQHVADLYLDQASDYEIADYAVQNSFIIVSKDRDFIEIASRKHANLKVILIRRGNCSSKQIEQMIFGSYRTIRKFILSDKSQVFKLI